MQTDLCRHICFWVMIIFAMTISLPASDPLNVALDAERYSAPESDFAGYYSQTPVPTGYISGFAAGSYKAFMASHVTGDYGLFHVTGWGGTSSVNVIFKVDGNAYVTDAAAVAVYQTYLATGSGSNLIVAHPERKYYILEVKAGSSGTFIPITVSPASPPTVTGGVFSVTIPAGESDAWVKVIPVNDESATGAKEVNLEIQSSISGDYAIGDNKSALMVLPDDDIQASVTMPVPVATEVDTMPAITRIEYLTTQQNSVAGLIPNHTSEFVIDLRNRNTTDPTIHADAVMGLAKDKDYALITMYAHPGNGTYGNEDQFFLGVPSRVDDWTKGWTVNGAVKAGSNIVFLNPGYHGHFVPYDYFYPGLENNTLGAQILTVDEGWVLTDTVTVTTTGASTTTTTSSITVLYSGVGNYAGTNGTIVGPLVPGHTYNPPPNINGAVTITEVISLAPNFTIQLTLGSVFPTDIADKAEVYNFGITIPAGDPDYVTLTVPMGQYYGLEVGALPMINLVSPVDNIAEGAELIRLRMLDPFSYPTPHADYKLLNPGTATMVLADVNSYANWGAIKNAMVAPDISGVITVNLTSALPHDANISLTIDTANSTAIEGDDFKPIARTQTLKAGLTSLTFSVEPKDNTANWGSEQSRNIRIRLVPSTEYLLTSSTGSSAAAIDVNISKGAGTVTVVAATPNVYESTTATVLGSFTVNLARTVGITRAVSVNYKVTGTATAGADYLLLSGSVTVAANTSSVSIPVTVLPDRVAEGNETLIITLDVGDGYGVDPTPATMTIVDAAPQIQVSADTTAVTEGEPITVTLSYTGSQAPSFTVSYVMSGTATKGLDYADPGTLQFSDTSKVKTFQITPTVDGLIEGDETLIFTLAAPSSIDAYFLGAQTTFSVTIHDADVPQDPTNNDKPTPSSALPPTSSGGGSCGLGSGIAGILGGLLLILRVAFRRQKIT